MSPGMGGGGGVRATSQAAKLSTVDPKSGMRERRSNYSTLHRTNSTT